MGEFKERLAFLIKTEGYSIKCVLVKAENLDNNQKEKWIVVVLVIGLEKLSTLGLEGSGAIVESLFLNCETVPSGDKKLVSLDGGI